MQTRTVGGPHADLSGGGGAGPVSIGQQGVARSSAEMRYQGTGQTRWGMRWKPALNAFAITFADRMPAASTYH